MLINMHDIHYIMHEKLISIISTHNKHTKLLKIDIILTYKMNNQKIDSMTSTYKITILNL